MAVEWALGAGIAVVKVVLRLYGDPDVADMVDDAVAGVGSFRTKPKRKDLGRVFASRIDADVPARLRAGLTDQETAAAARIAADVVAGLAEQPEALATALARPEEFPAWVREHGGIRVRQDLVAPHAEDLYDAVLVSAATQLVALAPTSQRAVSAAMAEALRQLAAVMSKLDDIHAGVQDLLQRPSGQEQVSWPVVPRPAPARATAYQDRDVTAELPASGTVVLAGSSGFGKTQIAAGVFATSVAELKLWVPASSRDQVLSGYADAAVAVGIADASEPVEERAVRFLGWLTAPPQGRSWLIVLDDFIDPADLAATETRPGWWPPVTNQGLTVVTTLSQSAALSTEGRRLQPVDHYSRTESVNYLTRRLTEHAADLPADVLDDVDKLAEDLGDHPLALGQAAAVIITDQASIADYRTRLAAETLDQVLPETAQADGYTRPLHKAFQIALDRAQSQSPHAAKLLSLLGMLDPTGAPRDLLDTQVISTYLNTTGQETRTALRVLRSLSLTSHTPRLGPRALRTHPLIGRMVREQDLTETIAAGRAAAEALTDIWPEIEHDPTHTAALRANASILDEHDAKMHHRMLWDPTLRTYSLVYRQTRSLGEAGLLAAALVHSEHLAATATAVLGPDHPDTLSTRGNLAYWRGEAGDPAGAAAAYEGLLADFLRVLGPDHLSTLTTRGNLARSRGGAGDPAGAAAAYEGLLADRLRVLGPDHPDTLTTRSNLAYWRGEAGDPAGAAAAYEGLLADFLRVLGPDHPNTLTTRSNLARSRVGMTRSDGHAIRRPG